MEKNSAKKTVPRRILLVYNPVAGRIKIQNSLCDILNIFSEAGCNVYVCGTTKNKNACDIIYEFYDKDIDIVVCCGGDGTLNQVINGVLSSKMNVSIGYIPCGTTNDFARGVGIPLNPTKAAESILNGHVRTLDVGLWKSGEQKKYFSYIASFGAFTDVSYSTPQKIKNVMGHAAYVLGGVQPFLTITKAPLYHVEIDVSEKRTEGNYIFGAISNSRSVGGIIKLKDKDIKLNDGKFEAIFIKRPKTALQLNELLPKVASGELHQSPLIDYFKTSEMTLKVNSCPWSLDGEKINAQEKISINAECRALKFII